VDRSGDGWSSGVMFLAISEAKPLGRYVLFARDVIAGHFDRVSDAVAFVDVWRRRGWLAARRLAPRWRGRG